MVQVKGRRNMFCIAATLVVCSVFAMPGAMAQETDLGLDDEPTVAAAISWVDGTTEYYGIDAQSDDDHGDAAAAWAANEARETEAVAWTTAALGLQHLDVLKRQADEAVETGQSMLAQLAATESGDEESDAEPTAAYAKAPQSRAAAIVVASVAAAAAAGSLFAMFWTAGSTVGTAGSAAAGSKTSAAGLKKVAPAFSPLFTRFEGRDVLKHPNRAQLYTLVSANPGVRLQDLCEETMLSRTAVTHHLRLLEQQHVIVSERVGRSRHFYENGGRYERAKKEAYAVLQNDRSKDIAQFILANPGTIQKSLCESLSMRASIAHWHVKRLEEASLVEAIRRGRTVSYYPAGTLSQLAI